MQFSGLNNFAYAEIKKRLLENTILPNERIREDLIAEELQISRTPVREAINRLVTEGLVVSVPRKGLFAKEITTDDIEEMIEVRIVLEALSAELCCIRASDDQLKTLKDVFDHYEYMLRRGRHLEASELDGEIHNCIARISGNDRLIHYIGDLQQYFQYARARNVKWTQEMVDRSIKLHKNLLDAIIQRDASLSKAAIEEDVRGMRNLLP